MKPTKALNTCIFLCIFFSLSSCKDLFNKPDDWYNKTLTEFNTERQVILYKETCNYDVKVELTYAVFNDNVKQKNELNELFGLEPEDLSEINYLLSIFNYGGNLRLCNQYIDNAYIQDFSEIIYKHAIAKSDIISIKETYADNVYGNYSMATITTSENVIQNVLVTPLSQKAINNNDRSGLVLIIFYDATIQMALKVLFNTETIIHHIIEKYPDKVVDNKLTGSDLRFLKEGPGRFWFKVDL